MHTYWLHSKGEQGKNVSMKHAQKNTDFDFAGLCFRPTIIHKSQFCPIFFCFCAEDRGILWLGVWAISQELNVFAYIT